MAIDLVCTRVQPRSGGPTFTFRSTSRQATDTHDCCACFGAEARELAPCSHRALCDACLTHGLWTDTTTEAPLCPLCRVEVVGVVGPAGVLPVPTRPTAN
eukprot:TRINITY_DN522_c1_g1_i1.p2 TRINITY_DN522_c1_g1~~TRINITY_DN522_c1_g1_i1.p2  ORF type:complete len:100 (+),score=10.52 TRINITY_DN522_c1_g1_i1:448-747(+)